MHYDAYNDYMHAWESAEILVGVVEDDGGGGGGPTYAQKCPPPKWRKNSKKGTYMEKVENGPLNSEIKMLGIFHGRASVFSCSL